MAFDKMFARQSNVDRCCEVINDICKAAAETAFLRLQEKTPSTLVSLYWGIGISYVRNGAIVAWDFSCEDIEAFERALATKFEQWFVEGTGDASAETTNAAKRLFEASRDEGKLIMGLVWSEGGASEGLRQWSKTRAWGRDLLDRDDAVGPVALFTLMGVISASVSALKEGC